MGQIFTYQTALRIEARVNCDISGAISQKIKYIKPDGSTTGEWPGEVSDATNGVFYYDITTIGELDEVGDWLMWGYVTFSDNRSAPGEVVTVTIYDEGQEY